MKYLLIIICLYSWSHLLIAGEDEDFYNRLNPYIPSTFFIPMPTDILPMSLSHQAGKMHNYMVTMDSKLLREKVLSSEELEKMPYLSEVLKELAVKDGAAKVYQKGQDIHINIGFQYFTRRYNWYIYFKHDQNDQVFEQQISSGNKYIERWILSSSGVMFGSSVPIVSHFRRGYVSFMLGLGYLWNDVSNGIGAGLVETYHNQYGFIPLQTGLVAEWSALRIVNVSFWSRAYFPGYIGSSNEIDRQFSSVNSWFKYGIDVQGHLDINGLGVQTTLTSQVRNLLRGVRFKKVSDEEEEQISPHSYTFFNLSLSIPFEFK